MKDPNSIGKKKKNLYVLRNTKSSSFVDCSEEVKVSYAFRNAKKKKIQTHRRKRHAKVTNNSLLNFREVTIESHRDTCLFFPECVSKRRGREPPPQAYQASRCTNNMFRR